MVRIGYGYQFAEPGRKTLVDDLPALIIKIGIVQMAMKIDVSGVAHDFIVTQSESQ